MPRRLRPPLADAPAGKDRWDSPAAEGAPASFLRADRDAVLLAQSGWTKVIEPCRGYFGRLRVKAKDVKMSEYPDTRHAYDFPTFPATPTVAKDAQTTLRCTLREEPVGIMVNVETQKPFTYGDSCIGRDPHVAYSAASTRATEDEVKALLKKVFMLE
jgi:hypothetical protein